MAWTDVAWSWQVVVVRLAHDILHWVAAALIWVAVVVCRAVAALCRVGPMMIWVLARWLQLQWLPLDAWAPPHLWNDDMHSHTR